MTSDTARRWPSGSRFSETGSEAFVTGYLDSIRDASAAALL